MTRGSFQRWTEGLRSKRLELLVTDSEPQKDHPSCTTTSLRVPSIVSETEWVRKRERRSISSGKFREKFTGKGVLGNDQVESETARSPPRYSTETSVDSEDPQKSVRT